MLVYVWLPRNGRSGTRDYGLTRLMLDRISFCYNGSRVTADRAQAQAELVGVHANIRMVEVTASSKEDVARSSKIRLNNLFSNII
ncbi:hypothetical protein I3760_06G064900 [Carya illinoinensis]|nr:hypothetical protein I3760_06G064900 [Carya illinoinensis]